MINASSYRSYTVSEISNAKLSKAISGTFGRQGGTPMVAFDLAVGNLATYDFLRSC